MCVCVCVCVKMPEQEYKKLVYIIGFCDVKMWEKASFPRDGVEPPT